MKRIAGLTVLFVLIGFNLHAGDLTVDGKLGVGAPSSGDKVHVESSNGSVALKLRAPGDGVNTTLINMFDASNDTYWTIVRRDNDNYFANEADDLIFSFWNGATWNPAVNFKPNKNVAFNGYVGIGTASPTSPFVVKNPAGQAIISQYQNNDYNPGTSSGSMFYEGFGTASGNTYFKMQATQAGNTQYANLAVQPDGGNVGIGTASPGQLLELYRDNASVAMRFHDPGDRWFTMGIDYNDSRKFKISEGGDFGFADRMIIDGAGNVGIGTTDPKRKLHVAGDSEWSDWQYWNAGIPGSYTFAVGRTTNPAYTNGGEAFTIVRNNGSWSTAFLVDQDTGNVGIGTTNPGAKLDVNGITYLNGLRMYDDGSGNYNLDWYGHSGTGYIQVADVTGHLAGFRPRLDNWTDLGDLSHRWKTLSVGSGGATIGGNVGIGTTDPQAKLDVAGDVKISGKVSGATYGFGGLFSACRDGCGCPLDSGDNNSPGTASCTKANPFTSSCSCPANFSVMKMDPGTNDCIKIYLCWK